ncbi:phosrestin-2-like [Penaeus japonicus]|uniref:phosrestin-2-like n=1 Tax=Penaeus japonicus TaxID=27405 RepID=UPI001C70FE53|nr:phosrestin-2-like [Penaeus japonicus]
MTHRRQNIFEEAFLTVNKQKHVCLGNPHVYKEAGATSFALVYSRLSKEENQERKELLCNGGQTSSVQEKFAQFEDDVFFHTTQLYPPVKEFVPSEIQRNLISKLGNFAFPFVMDFPKLSSPSYVMQQGWEDEGSLMGVEFEVMGYVGTSEHDMPKRSTARLLVRRLQECPKRMYEAPVPRGSITKNFLTTAGNVSIEASLSKPVYEPEEDIPVKIAIRNDTNRDIKRLKVYFLIVTYQLIFLFWFTEHYSDLIPSSDKGRTAQQVPMFSDRQTRDKTIIKYEDPVNLVPGACTTRGVTLMCCVPSRTARGKVFLQGGLRSDCDDVIAPTTILNPEIDKNDVFGVYVSYVVRVKASLGTLRGDCILDVPFVLAVPQEH